MVFADGGHLLIELPDPESTWGRWMGRYWLPWFQPQHLHLMSIGILEEALIERGFTIVDIDRAEASQGVDLTAAVWMLIGRFAPPANLPWLPRPTASDGSGEPPASPSAPCLWPERWPSMPSWPGSPAGPASRTPDRVLARRTPPD